jgi:histidyl-tRNA synthetase
MKNIQSIKGTKDTLPSEIHKWQFLEDTFRRVSTKYGYTELRTPIFEDSALFHRGIGEGTDIVNKEMYTFIDKGGDSVTLRPEQTAALIRSVVQNNLLQLGTTSKFWYFGPYFRYERPQKGRLRQFHQYGAECIASPFPESDVEVILLANSIIREIGIEDYKLNINSLGSENSRNNYRDALKSYLIENQDGLSEDSKRRLDINPLRILDSKDEKDKLIIANAPNIIDYLDEESKNHFDTVINLLSQLNVNFTIEPKLVRGLDYYNHTVFEFQSNALGSQDSFGGGGRYNGLIEQLGGKPNPAVGFAFGVERLIIILDSLNKLSELESKPDFYISSTSEKYLDKVYFVSEVLRKRNFNVQNDLVRKSVKGQMREANKLGAKYAVIIGDDEIAKGTIILKNMTESTQVELAFDDIEKHQF